MGIFAGISGLIENSEINSGSLALLEISIAICLISIAIKYKKQALVFFLFILGIGSILVSNFWRLFAYCMELEQPITDFTMLIFFFLILLHLNLQGQNRILNKEKQTHLQASEKPA